MAWTDGFVRLMGLENNKAAHNIKVLEPGQKATITHVAWASNSVGKKRSETESAASTWQSVLGNNSSLPDLPRELMFLEVDTALPKISPLPSSSAGLG